MTWEDILRKDFKLKKPWYVRLIEWFSKKVGVMPEDSRGLTGAYNVMSGNVNIYPTALKHLAGDEPLLIDQLTEVITHEYIHKVLSETPGIKEELKHLGIIQSKTEQEWATHRMQGNLINGLISLTEHPQANPKHKERAKEILQEMNNRLQSTESDVENLFNEWNVPKNLRTDKYIKIVNEYIEGMK